jgi:hypothetical protein
MADICVYAKYTDAAGDGVDGIVVTWNCDRITRSTGARVALLTGEANNIVFGRDGMYGYHLAGADLITYDYVFNAITASALPTGHELAALWTLWSLSWHDVLTAGLTVVGSIGKWIIDNLNSPVGDICACVKNALLALPNIRSCRMQDLTIIRGDTWEQPITCLGDISADDEIWFTAKRNKNLTDAQADIEISLTTGLEVINQTAATVAGNGSITIDDAVKGDITVTLEAVEAAKLNWDDVGELHYDVQTKDNATGLVRTLRRGTLKLIADITRET